MPLITLTGDDTPSRQRALQSLVRAHTDTEGDLNLARLDDPDAATLMQACEAMPFLGTHRFTVVTDFSPKNASDQLLQFLGNVPAHCTLIFSLESLDARTRFAQALKKNGTMQDFASPAPAAFPAWIQACARERGIAIAPAASQLLADYTHGSAARASNELDKISAAIDGEITAADVRRFVTPDIAASIFELTDAIGQRQQQRALTLLTRMQDSGENLMQIFFMIARHLRMLLTINAASASGIPPAAIARAHKLHPYAVQKSLGQSNNFSRETLQNALRTLLTIDTRIKNGKLAISTHDQRELALAMECLVVQLTRR